METNTEKSISNEIDIVTSYVAFGALFGTTEQNCKNAIESLAAKGILSGAGLPPESAYREIVEYIRGARN